MMVDRRLVFEQKVLKKLYSSPPPERKIQEALTKAFKTQQEQEKEEERNKSTGDSKDDAQIIPVSKKVYTVNLPPSGNEVCSTRLKEHHESQDSSEEPEDSAKPGAEPLTKNRKRKLKKKRQKERLKAAGLAPRATAVEFMYEPGGGNREAGPAKSEER
ncbi:glutamate-rich protein 1 isoform X2 [Stegostoma tigrinum]|uniref:glutamate-rich protein 1 isoform X2 n=1 Tax=Stegostoma tigrinum TaxID=3053191 RepID=UPI00202B1D1C|nr:glutamate-rich protein 1 isoform X2 [Stegostoma tigrinum]